MSFNDVVQKPKCNVQEQTEEMMCFDPKYSKVFFYHVLITVCQIDI